MIKASLTGMMTIVVCLLTIGSSMAAVNETRTSNSGVIEFGYRSVDVNGSRNKFREDFNLDSGFRLFSLDLNGRYPQGRVLDRFDLRLDNLGGDPFVRYNLEVEKTKLYKIEMDFKKLDFFSSVSNEFLTFDTKREMGDVRVIIKPENFPKLTFSYGRITREGTLLTTEPLTFFPMGIFQMATPLDEVTDNYTASAEFSLGYVDVYIEQSLKKFQSEQRFTGPASPNLVTGQPAINVTLFNWHQLEEIEQPVARLKLHSKLFDRLDLSGSLLYSKAEIDVAINNQQLIDNTLSTVTGQGNMDKRIVIVDLEGTYALTRKLNLQGLGQWSRLNQDGELNIQDTAVGKVINFAVTAEVIEQEIETRRFGLHLEYFPLDKLSVLTGLERQQREIGLYRKVQFQDRELKSDATILLFGFNYKPVPTLEFFGRFQRGQVDNPFTNISPTDSENIKLRLSYKPRSNLSLVGTFTSKDTRNGDVNSTAHLKSAGFNLWYQPIDSLDLSLGYTRQSGRIFSLFTPLILVPDLSGGIAEYEADNDIISAAINYSLTRKLKFGFDYQIVDSNGTFPLQNHNLGLSVSYFWHKNIETKLKYQFTEYDLRLEDANDYTANMLTLLASLNF